MATYFIIAFRCSRMSFAEIVDAEGLSLPDEGLRPMEAALLELAPTVRLLPSREADRMSGRAGSLLFLNRSRRSVLEALWSTMRVRSKV